MPTLHRLSRADARPGVGRDCDAWCAKCKRETTHTIAAMVGIEVVKVHCKTCGADHKYKSAREVVQTAKAAASEEAVDASGETPRKAAKPARPRAASGGVKRAEALALAQARHLKVQWTKAIGDLDRGRAVPYAASMTVAPGQLVDHKTFGCGVVDAVLEGKSRFLFEDGYRTLVTGRG
jgi:hypothetical protein